MQGEGSDGDMELTRWRERGQEGYRVNEMESGEAARRAGKWSALWWEEAATGPTGGLPVAGFCRAQEPACPWPLGSPLAALGHTGREERQAQLDPGEGCGAGGGNGEQAMFLQGREGTKQTSEQTFHPGIPPCPAHGTPLTHPSSTLWCVLPLQETSSLFQFPVEWHQPGKRREQAATRHCPAAGVPSTLQEASNPTNTLLCHVFGERNLWGQQLSSATFIQGYWTQDHHTERGTIAFLPSARWLWFSTRGIIKPYSQGCKGHSWTSLPFCSPAQRAQHSSDAH